MHKALDQLPVTLKAPGAVVSSIDFGNMTVSRNQVAKGADFGPLLEGLPNDHCQCPHWGYVMKGKIRLTYEDGSEEVTEAGQFYYWPPGHRAVVEEDLELLEFSPKKEMHEVMDHLEKKLQQA